jgi:hypothetical protein
MGMDPGSDASAETPSLGPPSNAATFAWQIRQRSIGRLHLIGGVSTTLAWILAYEGAQMGFVKAWVLGPTSIRGHYWGDVGMMLLQEGLHGPHVPDPSCSSGQLCESY